MEGKLGHKKFDFSVWNSGKSRSGGYKPYNCGYAGCALGECPVIFPGKWVFGNDQGAPALMENKHSTIIDSLEEATVFFGISINEAAHLFIPGSQEFSEYGGMPLQDNATRQQVAMNIYAFIEVKKAVGEVEGVEATV